MSDDAWVSLPRLPIPDLEWVRDLVYFDGPLLSEFRSSTGDTYLFHWCDIDDGINRWMVFRVSRSELVKFIHRRLTLRKLIDESQDGFVYIVDIGDNRQQKRVHWAPLDKIPDDFLPESDSSVVFDGDRLNDRSYQALIDKNWGVEDLAQFPRKFTEVYTFLYLLGQSDREPPRSTHMFRYDFERGRGYAARHFFRELQGQIPKADRPGDVEELRYSSPGFISLKLNPKLGANITAAVNRYIENQASITDTYKVLDDFVQGRDGYVDDDDDDLEPGMFGHIVEAETDYATIASELCRRLGYVDWDRIYSACQNETRSSVRILLMYCRRIKLLAQYQQSGKVDLL